MLSRTSSVRPYPDCPLVVAYGLGVDSTAMLIEFVRRSIRPDLILFADTGGEKPETYQYLEVIQPYLQQVGFPEVVTVRYRPTRAVYDTLEGQCLHTGTLPSLAYGGKSCSLKYKRNGDLAARARRTPFQRDLRSSNGKRLVDLWLPIHSWTTAQVWQRIQASGVRYHPAYDLGMPRLSCCFCIFSPRSALLLAGQHNPDLLKEYVAVEQRIGHRFRKELPLTEVQAALQRGERSGPIANWVM